MNFKKPLPRSLTELTEAMSISEKALPQALTKLTKGVDQSKTLDYPEHVTEKEVTGFGSPICKRRMSAARRFFFVRNAPVRPFLWAAVVGRLRPAGFLLRRSSNPAICRPPRLEARCGLTKAKGDVHMSGIDSSKEFPPRNTRHTSLYTERAKEQNVIHIDGELAERFFLLLARLDETAQSLKTAAALFPKTDGVSDGELSSYITTIGYAMALDVMIAELMELTNGDDFGQIVREASHV